MMRAATGLVGFGSVLTAMCLAVFAFSDHYILHRVIVGTVVGIATIGWGFYRGKREGFRLEVE